MASEYFRQFAAYNGGPMLAPAAFIQSSNAPPRQAHACLSILTGSEPPALDFLVFQRGGSAPSSRW